MLTHGSIIIAEDTGKFLLLVSHGLPHDRALNFSFKDDVFQLFLDDNVFCEIKDISDAAYKIIEDQDECAVFEMKNGQMPKGDVKPKIAYRV